MPVFTSQSGETEPVFQEEEKKVEEEPKDKSRPISSTPGTLASTLIKKY